MMKTEDEHTERRALINFMFLWALTQKLGDRVYQGTVTAKTKAKRRALNRRQKASRHANRGK